MTLTFDSLDASWWPYLYILVAGVLATEFWRWLGVIAGSALAEGSQVLIWVRAAATALVAAVVGQLILFPTGDLAATPAVLRAGSAAIGWLAFWYARRSPLIGVIVAEAMLVGGWIWLEGGVP